MPTSFAERDIRIAEAVVSCHENGRPHNKYDAVATLPDGPSGVRQITYGAHQATDASNALDQIIERYIALKGEQAEAFGRYLPLLRKNTKESCAVLASDQIFINMLREAASESAMVAAQNEIFRTNYMLPAIKACQKRRFSQPLSLAVIYDSLIHGGFGVIANRVKALLDNESVWIASYLIERRNWLKNHPKRILNNAVYRMDTFLDLLISDDIRSELGKMIEAEGTKETPSGKFCELVRKGRVSQPFFNAIVATGNWALATPLVAHGVTINETDLD